MTTREIAAHRLEVGTVILLPFERTATVSAVKPGKRFVTVTTEHGVTRYDPTQLVMVEASPAKPTRGLAVYVCGPDEKMWGEPFIVSPHDPTLDHPDCEAPAQAGVCGLNATWYVEVAGWLGAEGTTPGVPPVRYVCSDHLAATLEEYA